MTTHIGYVSESSLAGMYSGTIKVLQAYRRGSPINVYKPSAKPSG